MTNAMNGEISTSIMRIERLKLVGSVHFLPFVALCYDSRICEKALTIGWLWWGFALVRVNEMHL